MDYSEVGFVLYFPRALPSFSNPAPSSRRSGSAGVGVVCELHTLCAGALHACWLGSCLGGSQPLSFDSFSCVLYHSCCMKGGL